MYLPDRPQVVVAQIGSRMHYAVPALLARSKMLEMFFTDVYVGPGSSLAATASVLKLIPERRLPQGARRFLGRREDSIPANKVHAFNLFGLLHTREVQHATSLEQLWSAYRRGGTQFCKLVAAHGFGNAQVVYTFNAAGREIQLEAKQRRVRSLHEQTIAPMRERYEILSEESQRWPAWEDPLPGAAFWQPVIDREQEEWDCSDVIVCASEFVADGLHRLGVPAHRVRIVPYGIDTSRFTPKSSSDSNESRNRAPDRPLRLLYVGAVNLRKGIQYLHRALELLGSRHLEVRVVGPVSIREPFRSQLANRMQLLGPVPRSEVVAHFRWADIFVFPSVCEGSATVIYEALAVGLPTITTPNSGSVVRDGQDGYIVDPRDPEAIADRICRLGDNHDLLEQMSRQARERAQEYSWGRYAERLISVVKETSRST